MAKILSSLFLATLLGLCLHVASAQAQLVRTCVSLAKGSEASISVSGGTTGIIVNAPNGGGYVNLRGLTIQGVGFGTTTGLRFNTGFSLTMTDCVVRNHTGNGIEFQPNANSNLSVSKTLVADNGGDAIRVKPPSGSPTVKAVFNRV